MRIKKRRLIGSLVVLVAAGFAACISRGEPDTSSTGQAVFFQPGGGSGYAYCGSAALFSSIDCPEVTITPNVGDNYLLTGIDATNCQFMRAELNEDLTGRTVPITCTGVGSGSSTAGSGTNSDSCIPQVYTVLARYLPQFQGSASCTMYATLVNQSSPFETLRLPIYFSGYGIAPQTGITVSTSSLDLGQVPVNMTSAPSFVTVTNVGSTSVTVNVAAQPSMVFVQDQPGNTFTLAASGSGSNSRAVGITCRPPSVGSQGGTITFSPSSGSGSAQTVNLACTGVNSNLNILPSPAAFASTLVHLAPPPRAIDIYAGSGGDYLTTVQLDATSSADLSITSGDLANGSAYIDAGSGHRVVLAYAPTAVHTGSLGRLMVSSVNNPTPRAVEITAEAQLGKIAAAPGAIDLGPVCVGSTASATFEVYAEAPGSFNLMSIAAPGAPFDVSSSQFDPGMQLIGNRGNAVAFTASVTPTEPGELTDMVTINTNLPEQLNPILPIQLHAVALPAGVSPTPGTIDFGPNKVLMPSFGQKIVLTNCGAGAVEISDIRRITGLNASEFTVVSPSTPSVTIPPNGEAELLVVMNPTTPGAKTAQLEIVHPGGTATAMLTGTAFDENGVSDGELGTYYSCSAGPAAGFAPVGLALLLLRRRRRRQ